MCVCECLYSWHLKLQSTLTEELCVCVCVLTCDVISGFVVQVNYVGIGNQD